MGIVVRTNHGTEYLYFLAGKSQLFLGKKAELDGLNLPNLCKGIKMMDKTFDRSFAKYLKGVQEHARYLPPDERIKYLEGRIAGLDAMLRAFGSRIK